MARAASVCGQRHRPRVSPPGRGAYTHDNPGGDQAGLQDAAGRETPHGLHVLCIQLPHGRTRVGLICRCGGGEHGLQRIHSHEFPVRRPGAAAATGASDRGESWITCTATRTALPRGRGADPKSRRGLPPPSQARHRRAAGRCGTGCATSRRDERCPRPGACPLAGFCLHLCRAPRPARDIYGTRRAPG